MALHHVIAIDPSNVEAYYLLGKVLTILSEYEDAVQSLFCSFQLDKSKETLFSNEFKELLFGVDATQFIVELRKLDEELVLLLQ